MVKRLFFLSKHCQNGKPRLTANIQSMWAQQRPCNHNVEDTQLTRLRRLRLMECQELACKT